MKRVLVVGYYFADSNMGGVRLRRIGRLLPRHDWEPVVLTHPQPAGKGPALPEEARRVEVKAADLTEIYQRLRGGKGAESGGPPRPVAKEIGLTSKLNRWVMIPDKQMPWRKPAVQAARDLFAREKFDLIFASLEPRTNLLVAADLVREFRLPCVMEYRDLWTGNPYYHLDLPTGLHRWWHRRLERESVAQASRVSAVCRGIAEYLGKTHGTAIRHPIDLNYNFFDPEEYPIRQPVPSTAPFVISYMGAMYGNRSPNQFFAGMRAFIDKAEVKPSDFRFRWAGAISGVQGLDESLDRNGVRPYIDFLGQVSHQNALRELVQSDAALIIQAPHDAIHIPGKLFEAMGGKVPVLAIANPCEVTEIIERCRAGLITPHDENGIAAVLGQFYDLHRQGRAWEFNGPEAEKFSAREAVGKLAHLFSETLKS